MNGLLPLHERALRDTWRDLGVHWHAFTLPQGHSRPSQRTHRLRELPVDAALFDPPGVAHWIESQYARHVPASQPRTHAGLSERHDLGVLQQYRHQTNLVVTGGGESVYVVVQDLALPGRPVVRELWVEAVVEAYCAVDTHGEPPQYVDG